MEVHDQKKPKRPKTKDGQGSIWPVYGSDGRKVQRWRWKIMVGYLPDGRPDVRYGQAATEGEARKSVTRVASLRDERRLPKASATKGTVADLLRQYLATKRVEASHKTYRKEEQFISLHLLPHLGRIKQDQLTPADVRKLLANLAGEGLAPSTMHGIKGTLARAFDQAVIDDVLPRNVARLERRKRTRRASDAKEDRYAFTPDEVVRIKRASAQDRFYTLWVALLYTGMRFGEAAALTWRDFDARTQSLSISKSLERVAASEPTFSDPKSYSSRRTLKLPEELAKLLSAHKAAQNEERLAAGANYHAHELIFCARNGAPLVHGNLYRSFKGLMRRLDIKKRVSPHTCRHTAATNLLYAGVPLPEVSRILGHADVAVTAKTYSHALDTNTAWQSPANRRGLEVLAAWYAQAEADAKESLPEPLAVR